MTDHGLVVIGSGPGGVSAAVAYRQADGDGPARIITTDADAPYERPPLSKDFLRGESEAVDALLHPRSLYADLGIELVLDRPVTDLVPEHNLVVLGDGSRLDYRACVLATGSDPVGLPIAGADRPQVHTLRSLRDARTLRTAAAGATCAVVAGSGFIGCEAATSLAARGLPVTLITDEPRPHGARLGEWVGERIEAWLRGCGVDVVTGERLELISETAITTDSGTEITADLVLLATGVRPCADLAEGADLDIECGRVRVDAAMRTSADNIYAVGDVALAHNTSAGRRISVEHWGDAMTMGEIAGAGCAGETAEWSQAPGFWSTIGDHTLKYSAWGDGFDQTRVVEHDDGRFTVWYGNDGHVAGVLTHRSDSAYERGQRLVEQNAAWGDLAGP